MLANFVNHQRPSQAIDKVACHRWLTPSGGVQHGGKWGQPEEIIRLDGVRSLAAGSHLSAVVSDEGQLHIWGKLLSEVRSAVYGTSAIM